MENRSMNFSYGEPQPRLDRFEQNVTPQHSSLAQSGMQAVPPDGANPLDLTSAIVHELQRSNTQPGWQSWSQSLHFEQAIGLQSSSGSFLSQQNAGGASRFVPQYIPRFDEAVAPSLQQQMPTRLDHSTESESLASPHQGFYSRSSANRLPLHLAQQVLDNSAPVDSVTQSACCPWIERMTQADVAATPSARSLGISTSLSLTQRAVGDVSCVASHTVDFQSCYSSDRQQRSGQSMRSAFNCDPQRESTVEISADLCTDEEDLEARPVDEKRKKRMLSNRASAQRSRQRRQERLDQLEVLTARLRVENSTLQKNLSAATQVAKRFEDQNKNLQKKVERLTKELEGGKAKNPTAALDDCASRQQTPCASSCEIVGRRAPLDPNPPRDGTRNDGASTENDAPSNGNRAEVSPVRRSFAACRVGKKRSFDESIAGHVAPQPSRPRPSPAPTGTARGEASSLLEPRVLSSAFGLDASLKYDSPMDCLEADRWLEFAECFK